MLSKNKASHIAQEWIAAWNSHDIKLIMEHYSDNIEFISPFIVNINNDAAGTIKGKPELEQYFLKALQKFPNLHFTLFKVFVSLNSIVVYYKTVKDLMAAEYMELDDEGKIAKVRAHYEE